MTIRTQPVPARSAATLPPPPATGVRAATVRKLGLALTVGTLAWAATIFTVGTTPEDTFRTSIGDLGGTLFQLGVFALLTIQFKTMATGTSKLARGMLRAEYVLLALATLWSILHAVPAFQDAGWLMILDVFWPLSMLGMFVIGIKILFTGRWTGLARVWPTVAESWAVVTVPAFVIFGPPLSNWIGGGHLLLGYAALGVILALRPELTGAQD
ncbi:hypothetical protein [Micromonospora sp. SL4-19]|uniref:hypothetical protein n=1 Tax=Micromonospora sp. SL4-19 TaxID=3399129 RepID=UPI003A4D4D8B